MNTAFKLDKTKVKQSFSIASVTYDGVAQLQRSVGWALIKQLGLVDFSGRVLDLGCGTGFLSGELVSMPGDKQIIALDIALPMLQTMRSKISSDNVVYLCADAEHIPLSKGSVDRVFSSLALQWCQNLTKVFTDIKKMLKPGGSLMFSIFAPGTLQELKSAWAEVDNFHHVNEFYSAEELKLFLQMANFKNVRIEQKTYVSHYDTVMDLMKELKGMGAHNVADSRKKTLTTRTQLQQMISVYQSQWNEAFIPATFEVLLVSAEA